MKSLNHRIGILFVDDEDKTRKYFLSAFEDLAPVYLAANGAEGLDVFKKHRGEIGVVLSDNKMPEMGGFEFLERIRAIDDQPLRILITAYSDLDSAVDALNEGLLYSYLTKPWEPDEMNKRLLRALDRFWILRERRELLRDRSGTFKKMQMEDRAACIRSVSEGLDYYLKQDLNSVRDFLGRIPDQIARETSGEPQDEAFWNEFRSDAEARLARVIGMIDLFKETVTEETATEQEFDFIALLRETLAEVEPGHKTTRMSLLTSVDRFSICFPVEKMRNICRHILTEATMNITGEGNVTVQAATRNNSHNRPDSLVVEVIDSGPPIPEKDIRSVFDPFSVRPGRSYESGVAWQDCCVALSQAGGTISIDLNEQNRNRITLEMPASS